MQLMNPCKKCIVKAICKKNIDCDRLRNYQAKTAKILLGILLGIFLVTITRVLRDSNRKELEDMKLHDIIDYGPFTVTRVIHGWIYTYNLVGKQIVMSSVFVPDPPSGRIDV